MNEMKNWQEAAIHDLKTSNMTLEEIAAKHGRAPATIKKLQFQSGVIREGVKTKRGPKRFEERVALSPFHHAIGIRLNIARAGQTPAEFSQKLGMSVHMLLSMEHGHHDFTLNQLIKISTTTGLPISELMETFNKNIYQPRSNNARRQ